MTAKIEKKLKASKHRIVLRDGRELQYHLPWADDHPPQSLIDQVPPEVLDRLEVEIGCGKGEFISRRAARYADRFFVGIDRRSDRFELTERKLERLALGRNWLLLLEDARCFVKTRLPPIRVLHVYHPDPWPKARHHKHRFFRSPDARTWAEAVVAGGELRLSTDHREYYEEIVDIVMSWGLFDFQSAYIKTRQMGEPQTHFEGIFLRKNEPVYKAFFKRKV